MRIFISYRREDQPAAQLGQLLYRELSARGHRVFFDTESRTLGSNFEEKLNRAVDESDIVLALIGPRWVHSLAERTNQPDYVRTELQRALTKGATPVIPVCIDNTPFPRAQQLPGEIRTLAKRDGFQFHTATLKQSFETLLNELPTFSLFTDDTFGKQPYYCDLNYFSALKAPFNHPQWFARLWWVALIGLLPVIDLLVLRGWRLDLTRRIAYGTANPFPFAKDFGRFLASGSVLWCMTLLYALPAIALLILLDATQVISALAAFLDIIKSIFTLSFDIFWTAVLQLGRALFKSWLPVIVVLLFVFFLTGPLYRAAAVRYALTGKLSSFFHVRTNAKMVFANYGRFIIVQFIDRINLYIIAVPIGVLFGSASGGVGMALGFLIHYWVSGYLYGNLGKCVIAYLSARARPLRQPSQRRLQSA